MSFHTYLVSIGSNLGDRQDMVRRALTLMEERGIKIDALSELVQTAPIGIADQVFLNGAIVCSGNIEPDDFMRLLLDVESRLGRVRDVRWGNRSIDLDVLLMRDANGTSIGSNSELLTVPHPRMLERDFMLRPAAAVAGHWVLPFSDQTLRALCISRGWRPTWSNLKGDLKLWQALKGDLFSATTSRWWWPVLIVMLFLRLWFAYKIPFGNDEAYYWDWGRAPQPSYFDHPPFVSWISMLSRLLVGSLLEGPIQGRALVPFFHLGSTLLFAALVVRINSRVITNFESRMVLLITQFVPAFSLGGFMLMPDVSLIFFSTASVWFALAISKRETLRWWAGAVLGLFLGLAGLSKYHAFFIGTGLVGWLLWYRPDSLKKEFSFWFLLMAVGLFVVSPVIAWNWSNQWVSFKFQGARGFSGGGLSFIPAVRTFLAEMLFVGPAVVGGLWILAKKRSSYFVSNGMVVLWSSIPLYIILKIFSFTSQTLPHWSVPSIWLCSALLIPLLAKTTSLRWCAKIYGLIFCLGVPLLFSSQNFRRVLLRWTGDRPGGLGELTLWDQASRDDTLLNYIQDRSWIHSDSAQNAIAAGCKRELTFAAPRWFTVAQVAAHMPGQPIVETLDQDHMSYYHFRPHESLFGCPVLIFSEKSHWQSDGWNGLVQVIESQEFEIDGHRDRPIILGRAVFLKSDLSEILH